MKTFLTQFYSDQNREQTHERVKMPKSLKSTIPGMVYPSNRDDPLKNSFTYIEGRRKDDGAEGLWRIHDGLYDLNLFVAHHPGGAEWLNMTKGTDVTEAFEVHHLSDKAEQLLPKFFIRKAAAPRSLPYTFDSNGFYHKFKERAREALKNVDYHNPSARSKSYADSAFVLTILAAVMAAVFKSWIFVVFSGILLGSTTLIAHNFFHMRDNFRMFYFDLIGMSSKEWRISHALSHHLYPNTVWDMEVYLFEPFINYLPESRKNLLVRLIMLIITPIVCAVAGLVQAVKRYVSIFTEWKSLELRDLIPFVLPVTLSFSGSSSIEMFTFWLCILLISSFMFHFIGLVSAHHHPDIFHDGDVCREDLDWGLIVLDAVRDRKVIDDSLFLVLTSFGSHGLHHLLPTVDHGYLELCVPAFHETCREFGIDVEKLSQWDMVKGLFRQIARNVPRVNYRGGPDGGRFRR